MNRMRAFVRRDAIMLVGWVGACVATAAVARPGGGGGNEMPCYDLDPNITSACDHWQDKTHCGESLCPDVEHQDASPCPGVRYGEDFSAYSTLSNESCSKYRNICVGGTCYTELDPWSQSFACTSIVGQNPC